MALIASISGVRGTIGGSPGENLTPPDIVRFAAAYGKFLQEEGVPKRIVIGRDARPSGPMVKALVMQTLISMGFELIDLDLATTPTVEIAVPREKAGGGIILTASHNPKEWNALKLLNRRGEFLSKSNGQRVLTLYQNQKLSFAPVEELGPSPLKKDYLEQHIEEVLGLELVDGPAIQKADLKIAVDGVNSVGGLYVPALLRALGVKAITERYCEPTGEFPHNPEPLAENLTEICTLVAEGDYDLGIVVDPDVDRLAFITEKGKMFGEEYTLVAVADYVLSQTPGAAVSNLSSSRALQDICQRHEQDYFASAVGEVNVVEKMKAEDAVIGGEGNGGIIYPAAHYGRDALVGIGLFLTHLVYSGKKMSELRASYPDYFMCKAKVAVEQGQDVDGLLKRFANAQAEHIPNLTDGVKISFADRWVHLRKSNTEPIIRIYTEAPTQAEADALAAEYQEKLNSLQPQNA